MLSFKQAFSLSSFTLIKRLFISSSFSDIRVVSSACLRLLFLPEILTPTCGSSSTTFHMMHSAEKLNNQGDTIQSCGTPFQNLKQSIVPYLVLFLLDPYRFLRRQVRWSDIPSSFKNFPQFVVIHIVKDFGIVNEAEVDVFVEFFRFAC